MPSRTNIVRDFQCNTPFVGQRGDKTTILRGRNFFVYSNYNCVKTSYWGGGSVGVREEIKSKKCIFPTNIFINNNLFINKLNVVKFNLHAFNLVMSIGGE